MKVAIIGGGVMGEAILGAALERGVFAREDVTVCEVVAARRKTLADQHGVNTVDDASRAMTGADLVVLAVKPQDAGKVGGTVSPSALVLSVMAGITLESLVRQLGHARIVRVMPNTPVASKAGMSVWTATAEVDESQRQVVRSLLSAIGRELYVEDEKKIDMATAVSGSGPAYVFLVIEAMVDAGVAIGLTRAQATEMVVQTVYGSALYAQESGRSAAELRANVTSPAGTTAAGLIELERGAVRASFAEAISAAHRRAQELGGTK